MTLFDGICDQTKELQTLTGYMSDPWSPGPGDSTMDHVKWIISSSGPYMFVRFGVLYADIDWWLYRVFSARIHYGKDI